MEIIEFKSLPEFYEKEFSDIKNNTVLLFTDAEIDEREEKLKQYMAGKIKCLGIRIFNSADLKSCFFRIVRDVSCYCDAIYIITWCS